MDSLVFANVYTCNSEKNETFFTDDIEFYHDKGGLTRSRKTLVEELRNNFCGEGKTKLRRELIKGSMQVFPIKNYGAVQLGDHRFYVTENGKEVLSGVAKFIHVWKYENGKWRISGYSATIIMHQTQKHQLLPETYIKLSLQGTAGCSTLSMRIILNC